MKRSAAAFVLLAGLGGCMTPEKKSMPEGTFGQSMRAPEVPNVVGARGEPVAPASFRGKSPDGVVRADFKDSGKGKIVPVGGEGMGLVGKKAAAGNVPLAADGVPGYYPGRGILPAPATPPWGVVAAVNALPAGGQMAPVNARTSIRFGEPQGMKLTWYTSNGNLHEPLEAPARYNFPQGGIYRLKLSSVAGRPGVDFYPTLEVVPAGPKTATYLAHSSVPVSFTDDDFEQVSAGNFLVKVIYLPDPQYQDLAAVAGPAEVISTRLEPGVDPIVEARRRGEILAIIRMGNIDLEAKGTPAMDAPVGGIGGPMPAPGIPPMPPPGAPGALPIIPPGGLPPMKP
jgi:hypothetical protein